MHSREPPDARALCPVHRCQPRVTLLKNVHRSLTVTFKPSDTVKYPSDVFGTHRTRTQRGCKTHGVTGRGPPEALLRPMPRAPL